MPTCNPAIFPNRQAAIDHFLKAGFQNFLDPKRVAEWAQDAVDRYIARGEIIIGKPSRYNVRLLVVGACDDLLDDVMESREGAKLAMSVLQELSLRIGTAFSDSRVFIARVCYAAALQLLEQKEATQAEAHAASRLLKVRLGA